MDFHDQGFHLVLTQIQKAELRESWETIVVKDFEGVVTEVNIRKILAVAQEFLRKLRQ